MTDIYGATGGRHRRRDPGLVVHLVFADGGEATIGADSAVARSIAHLAALIAQR